MITQQDSSQFQELGYLIKRSVFSADEAAFYRDYFTEMRLKGSYEGDDLGVNSAKDDLLRKYPRMIHMHRWDETARRWLLDSRINECLTGLLGREPYAVQTMLYFKPPGTRGQALHQDNYYLRVQPGTCIAAWLALDSCDDESGCIRAVPGSHKWPLLCTVKADTNASFTDVTVPVPEGTQTHSMLMEPGDVLFFNGSLVHGSLPNTTPDRFRRALIGHYIEGNSAQIAEWYNPALRMDGTPLTLEASELGGKCGVWVERDGARTLELAGYDAVGDASKV